MNFQNHKSIMKFGNYYFELSQHELLDSQNFYKTENEGHCEIFPEGICNVFLKLLKFEIKFF